MPKISIILPTYNWEKYLKETINSVINQSFNDFELIIINDDSSDWSEDIIKYFNDKRIIYLKNEKNINIVWSRNKWLEIAQWDYICFLDHDDLFIDKNKLKIQYDFLEKNIDYWMVWTWTVLIDENSKEFDKVSPRISNEDLKTHLIMSNQFYCWSVMFRKSLIEKIWFLDKRYTKSDDYDYWLRIWKVSKIKNLEDYSFSYRIHSNNTTFQWLNRYKMILMWFKLALIHWIKYPNYIKQISIRFLWDFVIPEKLLQYLIKKFKNKI